MNRWRVAILLYEIYLSVLKYDDCSLKRSLTSSQSDQLCDGSGMISGVWHGILKELYCVNCPIDQRGSEQAIPYMYTSPYRWINNRKLGPVVQSGFSVSRIRLVKSVSVYDNYVNTIPEDPG